jgi:hypothetical protein
MSKLMHHPAFALCVAAGAFVFAEGCGGDDSEATTPHLGLTDGAADGTLDGDASTEGGQEGAAVESGGDADAGQGDAAGSGDILIADALNNRVIEIDPTGRIVWTFGDGSSVPSATAVVGPSDSERIPTTRQTLIVGAGLLAGSTSGCDAGAGCPDNRVLLVDSSGAIVWQYGQTGIAGSGADQLSAPVAAVMLSSGNVLVTDRGNQRVIEVDNAKDLVWQYGTTGTSGSGPNQLNGPGSAERLPSGNTLIADQGNDRVIELDTNKAIIWTYPASPDTTKLNGPAFASRLPNGNTLIADSNNSRIVEVTPTFVVAWSFDTNTRAMSNAKPLPSRAVRLAGGNTLISDQFNHQVIEVDGNGNIVFGYGQIDTPGNGAGQLDAPHAASVIGDFTGVPTP